MIRRPCFICSRSTTTVSRQNQTCQEIRSEYPFDFLEMRFNLIFSEQLCFLLLGSLCLFDKFWGSLQLALTDLLQVDLKRGTYRQYTLTLPKKSLANFVRSLSSQSGMC